MMFLDCPAYVDQDGAARCGLPAEVTCSFIMRSTDGPVECAKIRCPAGHWFNGAIESLTWDGKHTHDVSTAAPAEVTPLDLFDGRHP
jgi:DNA-binding transcriptional regulator YdaS (Cro superfamily)